MHGQIPCNIMSQAHTAVAIYIQVYSTPYMHLNVYSTAQSWSSLQDPQWDLSQCLLYIGQTGRTLKHRLTEHKRALRSGETAQSAVVEHAINEGHTIKWDDAEVVDHSTRFRQRCILEAWHIRTEWHTMNCDEGPLPSVYNPLIHLHSPH